MGTTLYLFCVYFGLCGLVTLLFYQKGKSPLWGYFLLSVVTTPFTGVFVALYVEKDYYTLQNRILNKGEYRLCPYCAELTPIGNNVCVNCEREADTNTTTPA